MAIALPPPSTPELAPVDVVRAGGSEILKLSWQQNTIHVLGVEQIDKSLIEVAITTAGSLSDVVRQIQAVYYIAGYPAVQVRYALVEPDLYMLVVPGKITRVVAAEPYGKYFDGLAGADPLTDDALEPPRILASIHSDRNGEDPTVVFQPEEGGAALVVKSSESGPPQGTAGLEFGNPGNRFSGRYLANYFGRAAFGGGDEFRFEGRNAFTGLEKSSSPAEGYQEYALGWNRVNTLGLLGLQARYVGYQQEFDLDLGVGDRTRFSGKILQYEASLVHPLAASFNSRWNLSVKADYTKKTYEIFRLNQDVQRQEYGSAEIGTDYAQVLSLGSQRIDFSAGVAVRSGLASDETDVAIKAADFGYLLYRPTLNLALPIGSSTTLGLTVAGQFTSDTLPEQQQWVVGGIGNGEAFLPGVAAGDSGGVARLSLQDRLQLFGLPVTPRVFVEYGFATFENPFEDLGQEGSTQSVADAGVSLAVRVSRQVEARASYAESFEEKNISDAALDAADANLFFSVAVTLP